MAIAALTLAGLTGCGAGSTGVAVPSVAATAGQPGAAGVPDSPNSTSIPAATAPDGPSSGPSPTASPTPQTTRVPAAAAAAPCLADSASGPFLRTDGANFTCAGQPVALTGFTFYPAVIGGAKAWHSPGFTSYIDHVLDMGAAAGQNLIRATDQWDSHTAGQSPDDPVLWANMDYLLKAARARGVFVVVDLSALRWVLISQGEDPNRADLWTGFVAKVATRYRDNPAVAFYSIAGEPKPPDTPAAAAALTAFYRTTSQALRVADPNHLITVGGFNHMEDHPELGWWQAIDALPTNDIVAVKTYSQHDLDLMPTIASYGRSVGKPVVDEEFGMPQGYGDAVPAGGTAFNGLTGGRAAFFASVYSSGRDLGFAGFIFWNMGCQQGSTSYEVNPGAPAAWAVLIKYGAVPVFRDALARTALCP